MNRKVKYLPCSIVCHGECEVILVKQIQAKMRRNLNPLSKDGGSNSILINTINHYLEKRFPEKKTYIKKNNDLLNVDKENHKILNHKIFTIMDRDDSSDELFASYLDKSLFKDYWWGQEQLIEPIYFDPNMDAVLRKYGIEINAHSSKPSQYFKLLTTKYDDIIDVFKNLDEKSSNIKMLFEYLDTFNSKN